MAAETIPYGRSTQHAPAVSEVHIVWITAGLGCDGDSVSITAATQPSIEDVLLGAIPGLPKVHLHNPVLAYDGGRGTGGAGRCRFHLGGEVARCVATFFCAGCGSGNAASDCDAQQRGNGLKVIAVISDHDKDGTVPRNIAGLRKPPAVRPQAPAASREVRDVQRRTAPRTFPSD